jgi:protoheme IX farnesyltransferase
MVLMSTDFRDRARRLRRLSWTAAGATFALIVLGGIVRITGSGMGCGDHWPRCNGEWFPPLDLPTLIEIGHRWAAALVSILIFALAFVAWRTHRDTAALARPATAAAFLLVLQVFLGAVTVWFALPPWVVITHLANAMVLLAVVLTVGLRAGAGAPAPHVRHPDHGWAVGTAAIGFGVILLGAQVANFHAGMFCLGFPFCGDSVLPPAAPLARLHWTHRVAAYGFALVTLGLVVRVYRRRDAAARGLRRATAVVAGLALLQIAVGAGMVLHLLPPALRAAHLLIGTAVWVALVVLAFVSARTAAPAPAEDGAPAGAVPSPSLAADLVTLTKPRIISLLLLTTIAPMFITPAGLPSVGQLVWVTIGGYLMAGGANTINMWFDRDIDLEMGRTRQRPIPAGRISPAAGLTFGLALAGAAFAIFWHQVNPLSAWLALGGLLCYVFVYTVWLKRSSPQNIVIGGAAGAFPPLVGWAAMTGSLDLAAIYLFAIIFYWTPPHFWALALVKRADYARAGIPMLPVVRGEERTKVEMLIYTLILLPLTILPTFFGALGAFYGVAAALLGARLLWYCITLLREQGTTPTGTGTAWRMYRYSLLYLALLFVAMGIDRALPFGHAHADEPDIVILGR